MQTLDKSFFQFKHVFASIVLIFRLFILMFAENVFFSSIFGNRQLTYSFRLLPTSFDVSTSARLRADQNQMNEIRILCISNCACPNYIVKYCIGKQVALGDDVNNWIWKARAARKSARQLHIIGRKDLLKVREKNTCKHEMRMNEFTR